MSEIPFTLHYTWKRAFWQGRIYLTVTFTFTLFFPERTTIVVLPFRMPFTTPFALTVAIFRFFGADAKVKE